MPASTRDDVKRLFDAAVDCPRADRQRVIGGVTPGDPAVQREVQSLLDALDDTPPSFLETPAAAMVALPPSTLPQQRIGAYRLIREIGHGGMGTVFLAARDDQQFAKQVAIKLIRGGVLTSFLLQRFLNERQILATLEHPSIARLLDGGMTSDGVPYLVMEHVEGQPLDVYCTEHTLSIRERVSLFISICDAVAYAHRNLIIHRDIKPSNVMITPDRKPKLLDFGVAKLVDGDLPDRETASEWRIMTPRYASPEQLRGERVSIATDVYSLGVLLFELLTGAHPFEVGAGQPQQWMDSVLERQPVKPSNAAGALGDRWCRDLRGDLDNIVLKAVRREPESRYASVADLSGDLLRYLDGHPVHARPPTFHYRTAKFVGRNKVAVAAALTVAMALVGGSIIAFHQAAIATLERARAERHAAIARARHRDVQELAQSFLFELADALEPLPGSLQARHLVAQRALRQLDRLRAGNDDDPELRADLAAAYERVGSLTVGIAETERLRQTAVELNEDLVSRHPTNVRYRRQLASSLAWLGNVLKLKGDHQGELIRYRRAAALAGALATEHPEDVALQRQAENILRDLGRAQANAGLFADAVATQRRALAAARSVAATNPGDEACRREIVLGLHYLIGSLMQAGRWNEALAPAEEALPIAARLFESNQTNNLYRRDAWMANRNLGNLRSRRGEHRAALQHLRTALSLKQSLFDADPADRGHHRGLVVTHLINGQALERSGDLAAALAAYTRAIDLGDPLLLLDPSVEETYADLQVQYAAIRTLLQRLNRPGDEKVMRRREMRLYERVLQGDATNGQARTALSRLTSQSNPSNASPRL